MSWPSPEDLLGSDSVQRGSVVGGTCLCVFVQSRRTCSALWVTMMNYCKSNNYNVGTALVQDVGHGGASGVGNSL